MGDLSIDLGANLQRSPSSCKPFSTIEPLFDAQAPDFMLIMRYHNRHHTVGPKIPQRSVPSAALNPLPLFGFNLLAPLLPPAYQTKHIPPPPGLLQDSRYAVYIDAGSSGTRVHVFRYRLAPWPEYVEVDLPDMSTNVEPGLSHFAESPRDAAGSLQPLVLFAYDQVCPPNKRYRRRECVYVYYNQTGCRLGACDP